jgi:hypothetical protein
MGTEAERVSPPLVLSHGRYQTGRDCASQGRPPHGRGSVRAVRRRGDGKKQKIALQICLELTVHAKIEEEIFYPACEGKIEEDLLKEAYVEHDGAKVLIAEIEAGSPEDEFTTPRSRCSPSRSSTMSARKSSAWRACSPRRARPGSTWMRWATSCAPARKSLHRRVQGGRSAQARDHDAHRGPGLIGGRRLPLACKQGAPATASHPRSEREHASDLRTQIVGRSRPVRAHPVCPKQGLGHIALAGTGLAGVQGPQCCDPTFRPALGGEQPKRHDAPPTDGGQTLQCQQRSVDLAQSVEDEAKANWAMRNRPTPHIQSKTTQTIAQQHMLKGILAAQHG